MFGPSLSTVYAIRALECLARSGNSWKQAGQVASCTGIPRPYLVKLLHLLRGRGLVETKRGYRGGYRLAARPQAVSVLDVVHAIEGEQAFRRCLLGLGRCSSKRGCPLHPEWSRHRNGLEGYLRKLTLADLAGFDKWDALRERGFASRGSSDTRASTTER